ncbi:MAG: hypothetical protein IH934_08155 [Nanoarchaeota archaeon]|nr:hypothetical protein [Nanoarchaeota archaeon]
MESGNIIYVAKEYSPREIFGRTLPMWRFPRKDYILTYDFPHRSLGKSNFGSISDLVEYLAFDLSDPKIYPAPKHKYEIQPGIDEEGVRPLSRLERFRVNKLLESYELMQSLFFDNNQ